MANTPQSGLARPRVGSGRVPTLGILLRHQIKAAPLSPLLPALLVRRHELHLPLRVGEPEGSVEVDGVVAGVGDDDEGVRGELLGGVPGALVEQARG